MTVQAYESGYTCKSHETSIFQKSMWQGKKLYPVSYSRSNSRSFLLLDSINFTSNYTLQLFFTATLAFLSQHLTAEERDKTFG